MKNYITKSVIVNGSSSVGGDWDFDIEVEGKLPVVKSVVCLNDLGSDKDKIFISLIHNSKRIRFLDDVDCYRLTYPFITCPVVIDCKGSRYSYMIQNNSNTQYKLNFVFELEY